MLPPALGALASVMSKMISEEVAVFLSIVAGRLLATAKVATRLNVWSARTGSATEAASAAVSARRRE